MVDFYYLFARKISLDDEVNLSRPPFWLGDLVTIHLKMMRVIFPDEGCCALEIAELFVLACDRSSVALELN